MTSDVGLVGGRCLSCGATLYPSPPICPNCLGDAFASIEVGGLGRLYSFTILYGREGAASAVGYADMPNGVRLFGHLTRTEALTVDMGVLVSLDDARPGICRLDPMGG